MRNATPAIPTNTQFFYTKRLIVVLLLGFTLWSQSVQGSQATFNGNSQPLIDDILSAANVASITKSCASCQALLLPLKRLAIIGDDKFVSAIVQICKLRKLQDPDICEGDVGAQGPIIANALRRMSLSGRTARLFCNTLFGLCDPEPVRPYKLTFPPPVASLRMERMSRARDPFQVVHLSDVHIDREYTVGSEANCSKYICCRNFTRTSGEDEVLDPAPPFGHRRCDSPVILMDSALRAINFFAPKALFTISSGDVVDHTNWLLSQSVVEEDLRKFHEDIFHTFMHTNTFYGTIGNHDIYPTNDFPRSATDPDGAQWLFDLLSNDWKRWIGTNGAASVQHKSGSYAVIHPGTDLKIISVNTLYWYKYNFWTYDSDDFQPDPNDILSFLISELDAAEKAGQRAWILGHIPPGSSDLFRDQSNYYNQIVRRYHRTIAGQFYGHTHYDQFQIAYTDYSNQTAENAMSFGLLAPSLTPTNGNPAFTVYDVDPNTYGILDAKVYIANMTNPSYQIEPVWELYYSARNAYGPLVGLGQTTSTSPAPLDAVFWHRLTEVFETNDTAFGLYLDRTSRRPHTGRARRSCNDVCKNRTICDLRAMRAENSCYLQKSSDIIVPNPRMDDYPGKYLPESVGSDVDDICVGSSLPGILRRLISWSSA